MTPLTTYRAKGKAIGLELLFKYDLNGHLRAFNIVEGDLNEAQIKWLFTGPNFPASETLMRSVWMVDNRYKKKFRIDIIPADTSFDALWGLWNLKIKKEASQKAFNKLKEGEKIKCFLTHNRYKNHLIRTGQSKAHLVTWINQKRFNDEY